VGASIAFLDENHIMLGNELGFVAYNISQSRSGGEAISRMPYCSVKPKDWPLGCYQRSSPAISVIPSSGPPDTKRCVIVSGKLLHVADVPINTSPPGCIVLQDYLINKHLRNFLNASLSPTAGIFGYSRSGKITGHPTALIRAGFSLVGGAIRMGYHEGETTLMGFLRCEVFPGYIYRDLSFDEDSGYLLLVLQARGSGGFGSLGQSEVAMFSVM
jgi:hypothetical protein